jgi:hypothetical protein
VAIDTEAAFRRWRIKTYPDTLTPRSEAKHRQEWEKSREKASSEDAKQIRNTRQTENALEAESGLKRRRK